MFDFSASGGMLLDPAAFSLFVCLMAMLSFSIVGRVKAIRRSAGVASMSGGFNGAGYSRIPQSVLLTRLL